MDSIKVKIIVKNIPKIKKQDIIFDTDSDSEYDLSNFINPLCR